MLKPRKILLASDFSARCDRALDRALQLATQWNGKLTIAHIVESEPPSERSGTLEQVRERLREELPGSAAQAELIVRVGSAPESLAALAKETGSDVIVTGVARFNSWGDYFLGTAVEYIVRHAEAPVLVVRQRPLKAYKRLIVGTDFSACSKSALRTAGRLFADLPIALVHAWHVPFEAFLGSKDVQRDVLKEKSQEMNSFLENAALESDLKTRISAVLDEGEVGEVLHRHITSPHSDLLVLGASCQSGFAHALIGSNTADLLASVRSDVLVVRDMKAFAAE